MSPRETILSALQTLLLDELAGLCGTHVYRSRKEQLPALPTVIVRPDVEDDPGEMIGCSDSTLTVIVEIYARGDIPDQAADPVLSAALAAIKPDDALGLGTDVQIKPARRIEWAIENYDDAGITLRIEITYRTY